MKAAQFWILMAFSFLITALLVKEIFLSRSLRREQHVLVETQQLVSTGPAFENAWKQLAMRIFQSSRQDPELTEVLKKEDIQVRERPSSSTNSASATAPTTNAPPITPPSTSTPTAPVNPLTPLAP